MLGIAFSGMDAITWALADFGLEGKYKHLYSIDVSPSCRRLISQNTMVQKNSIFGDISTVNVHMLPYTDMFVAGFPCQPFSPAGKREGQKDSDGRGDMFKYCKDIIEYHKPKLFLLENVADLAERTQIRPTFHKDHDGPCIPEDLSNQI